MFRVARFVLLATPHDTQITSFLPLSHLPRVVSKGEQVQDARVDTFINELSHSLGELLSYEPPQTLLLTGAYPVIQICVYLCMYTQIDCSCKPMTPSELRELRFGEPFIAPDKREVLCALRGAAIRTSGLQRLRMRTTIVNLLVGSRALLRHAVRVFKVAI